MMEVEVTFVFDEILGRHMERLFGSRYGIGGLQLRIGTVACLTLLADQLEKEQPSGERYTTETLAGKLAELGFQEKEKAHSLIEEMREKGYILSDDQGGISAGKPAVSMARLLERVFPKLGMTLVAYFIQAVDEVLTGRKTTEVAVAHFDQTLKMQGVPLKQPKSEKPSGGQSTARKQKEGTGRLIRETQEILKSTPSAFSTPVEESGGIRIIGSAEDGFRYKLRDIQKAPSSPPEAVPDSPEPLTEDRPLAAEPAAEQPLEDQPLAAGIPAEGPRENPPASTEPPAEQSSVSMDLQPTTLPEEQGEGQIPPKQGESQCPPEQPFSGDMDPFQKGVEEEPQTPEDENKQSGAQGMVVGDRIESPVSEQGAGEPEEILDDLIDKEIAGFQNELASLCPLCKEGKVREEKTGTGKLYYKCTNKACNLVSWGRPHHMVCPVCSNPFLIEVSADKEKVSLQCPRATCKYQSTLSQESEHGGKVKDAAPGRPSAGSGTAAKPRRRVVRRRLVKKKK